MPSIYNALDLLVSTSTSEGFPNVLIEAMACGVPCVTTDVGDAKDIIKGAGLSVPYSNPNALATACLELIAHRMNGAAVRENVVKRYSQEMLVARTEAELCSLLALSLPRELNSASLS
jgi:glycosyltransferase involved in cell wall biosynthesis